MTSLCLLGQEDFDHIRPLSYPNTDIFLLAFAINSVPSFENIEAKWTREISKFCPGTPFIIVGTKSDTRENCSIKAISTDQGRSFANSIGACSYVECSALTQTGLKQVFDEVIRCGIRYRKDSKDIKGIKNSNCLIQ